ncbi:hypothetical protein ACS0TY_030460 [Phlomoides rotata]
MVHWLLPPDPWIKHNTDGSYDQYMRVVSGRGLIRDHLDTLRLVFHTLLVVTSSFDAVLYALIHGLYLARRFDAPVWIELDSLVVVCLLQTGRPGPRQITQATIAIKSRMAPMQFLDNTCKNSKVGRWAYFLIMLSNLSFFQIVLTKWHVNREWIIPALWKPEIKYDGLQGT